MKLAGTTITSEEMLLAAIVDNTKLLAWLQSKDGATGRNRPKSLMAELMQEEKETDNEIMRFRSGEEFEKAWRKMTGKEED